MNVPPKDRHLFARGLVVLAEQDAESSAGSGQMEQVRTACRRISASGAPKAFIDTQNAASCACTHKCTRRAASCAAGENRRSPWRSPSSRDASTASEHAEAVDRSQNCCEAQVSCWPRRSPR